MNSNLIHVNVMYRPGSRNYQGDLFYGDELQSQHIAPTIGILIQRIAGRVKSKGMQGKPFPFYFDTSITEWQVQDDVQAPAFEIIGGDDDS